MREACRTGRPVALSLEMFERDVQGVLDEYLSGSITERDLKQVLLLPHTGRQPQHLMMCLCTDFGSTGAFDFALTTALYNGTAASM